MPPLPIRNCTEYQGIGVLTAGILPPLTDETKGYNLVSRGSGFFVYIKSSYMPKIRTTVNIQSEMEQAI